MRIEPYLLFDGECEAAVTFYARLLGGRIEAMMTFEGSPAAGDVPEAYRSKILHASMLVGEQRLMASDAPPGHFEKPQGFSLSIQAPSIAEAERLFAALAEGGKVTMPLGETFWAARFAMLVDRFGTPWMINCERDR